MPNKAALKTSHILPQPKTRFDSHNEHGDVVCKRITTVAGMTVMEVCDSLDDKCSGYPICRACGSCGVNVEFFNQCPWTYRQVWVVVNPPQCSLPAPASALPPPSDKGTPNASGT